jgi:hypothetical protein
MRRDPQMDALIEKLNVIDRTPLRELPALRAKLALRLTPDEMRQVDLRIEIAKEAARRRTS